MKTIEFSKYEGTGNDFILINNLNGAYNDLSIACIKHLCDRKFGIGADGLILINPSDSSDFYMDYYNSDGSKSFCGNGSRCAVLFTLNLGVHSGTTIFNAIDGVHKAHVLNDLIFIEMSDVSGIDRVLGDFVLNTGSPHYVKFSDDLSNENVLKHGREIRYSDSFCQEGINVNLVNVLSSNEIKIATYERGVEDETHSCGTGATASAIIHDFCSNNVGNNVKVLVKGGELRVGFKRGDNGAYSQIVLSGPANFIFSGKIDSRTLL